MTTDNTDRAPVSEKEILFGRVIRERRTRLKMTQSEFASIMHVSRNTVINWENDRSRPEYGLIPEICAALGLKLRELFQTYEDDTLSELEARVVDNLRLLSPAGRRTADRMISVMAEEEGLAKDMAMKESYALFPVRPGAVAAGTGDYVPDQAPTYVFLRRNTVNAKADGIVKVRGDSMEPVYHSGDYVYYEEASSAYPGEDVIVDTDEGAVIKRLSADRTLYSVNPDVPYPGKSGDNSLVIRGKVLGAVHSSDRATRDETGVLEELFADEIREFRKKYGVGINDWT
ncbi:MAG: XRE family transcriptional regulator [Clostridiales bacterium]|nr:XRE family transcriptional regulator [Clostridiales bacterium]